MEQLTGIYAELAFVDVALNFGQSLIAFAIFGLDPSLGKLGSWLQKVCKKWQFGMFLMKYLYTQARVYLYVYLCTSKKMHKYQNKYYINLYLIYIIP